MRKRLRKKVGKYRCLRCGSKSGVRGWTELKSGRWVVGQLNCSYCDLGMPRDKESEEYKELVRKGQELIDEAEAV